MAPGKVRILVLEDEVSDFELVKRELRRTSLAYEISWAQDKAEYLRLLDERAPDLVLLDYSLPGFDGLEGMRLARERFPLVPVIIVSGAIGEDTATEAMKSGATDYVLKYNLERLERVILRALKESEEAAKRVRAEKELEGTRKRLEAIVGQMPTALLVFESGSTAPSVFNEEAYRMFGLPRGASGAEVRSCLRRVKIVDQDGRPIPLESRPALHSLNDGTTTRSAVVVIELPDGKRSYANMSSAPVRDREGNIVAAVAMFTDISEQMEMQSKIKSQAEELARSNAELEQFAYVASHDLQEPLRMVTGFLSLLQKKAGAKLTEDEKEYIKTAVDGASHMRNLIDDLLDYSRVQSLYRPTSDVDMAKVVDAALDNLRGMVSSYGAKVEVGPMPHVSADSVQMTQLMQNLISNAVKFHGAGPPEVTVACVHADDEWTFSVADNGIGIAPQHQQRIFEMFQRLHGRDQYPGTGIGLAIAKRIVQRHGGRIWVESAEGKGATFFFTLPGNSPSASAE